MNDYIKKNRSSQITNIIFAMRAQTLYIKVWHDWKYEDNACVACILHEENIEHFSICEAYENCAQERNWKEILETNPDQQYYIRKIAQKRMKHR